MNQLDFYYRALLKYRQITSADNDCVALRTAIAEADTEQDKIVITRAFCTIDEDWVNAIEAGLVHIEKAIKEERQFIRSNGEVVPIEKVKNVSKESVEHLARHSSLITRYTEGEDIIPDKLYTVERLNEYAVYENRFLYMLLCYLRDFVTLRYNDILDLTHKYDATVDFNKKVSVGKRKMTYTLSMHDVIRDDKYLNENNPARDIIDRIDLILKAILAFLATPLMEDVSKAPMLKPPITKTNVLKMNNNFKGAVALYDYILAYDKPGYTIEPMVNTIAPFKDELAEELAEAGGIISFLAYEYGLGIKPSLKEAYAREEERLKAEEIKQRDERIASLKRKLKSSGASIEEYAVMLEKQLRALEGESARASSLSESLAEAKENGKQLNLLLAKMQTSLDEAKAETERRIALHFEEMQALKREHEDALHEMVVKHEAEISEFNAAMAEAEARYSAEIADIREETKKQIDEMQNTCNITNETLEKFKAKYETLSEQKLVCEARIKALGGIDRDYTDRESFNMLENEYNAFRKIYKEQWDKTKKAIRKNRLNIENIKGSKETGDNSD